MLKQIETLQDGMPEGQHLYGSYVRLKGPLTEVMEQEAIDVLRSSWRRVQRDVAMAEPEFVYLTGEDYRTDRLALDPLKDHPDVVVMGWRALAESDA